MESELDELKSKLQDELKDLDKEADVLNVKSKYVGKKSKIFSLLSDLKSMSTDDKRKYGSLINNTKKELEEIVANKLNEIESKSDICFDDTIEEKLEIGSLHPVTLVANGFYCNKWC